MTLPVPQYGYSRTLKGVGLDEAIRRTTEALKAEGFGVLTTIDVKQVLKAKLDVEFRPYVILGACNPQIAHQGLIAEPGLGLLLPCNVVVAEDDGGSVVQAIKPAAMFEVVKNPALDPLMRDADARLQRALDTLG